MNIGNMLRARAKKGEEVVIGNIAWVRKEDLTEAA